MSGVNKEYCIMFPLTVHQLCGIPTRDGGLTSSEKKRTNGTITTKQICLPENENSKLKYQIHCFVVFKSLLILLNNSKLSTRSPLLPKWAVNLQQVLH